LASIGSARPAAISTLRRTDSARKLVRLSAIAVLPATAAVEVNSISASPWLTRSPSLARIALIWPASTASITLDWPTVSIWPVATA